MNKVFLVPHNVFEDEKFKELRLSSKYLYCYLAKLRNQYQNRLGWFWYKMTQLSVDTGMNLKTVKRAKKQLLQNNFIEVKRRRYKESSQGRVDFYRILEFPLTSSEEYEIFHGRGHLNRH